MGNSDSSSVKQYITETWSRCSTESDTVAHRFQVTNFSLLRGMGTGNFISSSTFSVGGCEWDIRFYPDGSTEDSTGAYASAYLHFCRGEPGVKTQYTLSLLDQHGRVSVQLMNLEQTFQSIDHCLGYSQFIRKSKLRRLLSCNDDGFTIRCVLTVMKKHHLEDVSTVIVPTPPSNLHEDFGKMLKDGEGADVRFSVGDQSFCAHRSVLASRSPVFKAELFNQMKESSMQHIKIDDMEPSIFEALLHFVYTDTLPDNCDVKKHVVLQHLFVAADRYELDRLVTMCEGKLCQSIDVQTIATTLTLAEQHGRMLLKNACIRFLSSQDVLSAVKETDGFKHLMTNCPLVMVDILEQKLLPSEVARSQPSMTPGRVVFRSAAVLVVVSVGFILLSRNGDHFARGGNEASRAWLVRSSTKY